MPAHKEPGTAQPAYRKSWQREGSPLQMLLIVKNILPLLTITL